jgi:hypothetical protein
MPTSSDRLLTPAEAAELLGDMPVDTLRLWRYRGTGPRYVRVGRHVRYRPADLAAWIDERVIDPQAA